MKGSWFTILPGEPEVVGVGAVFITPNTHQPKASEQRKSLVQMIE